MTPSLLRAAFTSAESATAAPMDADLELLLEAAYQSLAAAPDKVTRKQLIDSAALFDAFGLHDEAGRLFGLVSSAEYPMRLAA